MSRKSEEDLVQPIRILHLSDLHIGADADVQSMLQPLIADLRDPWGGLGFGRLDYLVVSGDLATRAKAEEYEKAQQFIEGLVNDFDVALECCIIVPGNHDLDRDQVVYDWKLQRQVDVAKLEEGSYTQQGQVYLLRDDCRYPLRFTNFSESLYCSLFHNPYPLEFDAQCIPFLFPESGIQFLAINSCWQIDEFNRGRADVHAGALSRGLMKADDQIRQARQEGQLSTDAHVLRIGVWHHPVTGNDKIVDDAFLERLRQADFKLCLHGHIHEERADLIGYLHPTRKLYIAGAGSFGAPARERPESIPRLYNVLEIAPGHSEIRVHTRCLRKSTGAWESWAVWPGASPYERRTYYTIEIAGATESAQSQPEEQPSTQYALVANASLQLTKDEQHELHERIAALEQKPQARMSAEDQPRTLELAMYHNSHNDLVRHLTLPVPRRPRDNKRLAEQIPVRLYLLNRSGQTAHYVQIEMLVKARFLAYSYTTASLEIEERANRWHIEQIDDTLYRCAFEGGADFVGHSHNGGYIDLGLMRIMVPHGEADGEVVTANIRYKIVAKEHTGSGVLVIWLQAATD